MTTTIFPEHDDRGPSTLARIKACPGSYLKNKSVIKKDDDNADSRRGTFLHNIVVEVWRGKEDRYNDLSDGDKHAIDNCIATLHSYDEISGTWFFEDRLAVVDPDTGEVITYGTADAYKITNDGYAILIDWKMGFLRVDDPIENWQLSAYAVMIMQKYQVKEVESLIVQPFNKYKSYTWSNEAQIIKSIKNLYAESEKIDAPLCAGAHCKHCPSNGTCEVLDLWCERAENIEIDDITPDNAGVYKTALAMRKKQILAREDELKKLCHEHGGRYGNIGFRLQKGNIEVDIPMFLESAKNVLSLPDILPICKLKVGDSGTGENKVRGAAHLYAEALQRIGEVKKISTGKERFEELRGVNRGPQKEVFCMFKD